MHLKRTALLLVTSLSLAGIPASQASAFSQIVDDDGNAIGQEREGIVSVPLPPLQGPSEPKREAPVEERSTPAKEEAGSPTSSDEPRFPDNPDRRVPAGRADEPAPPEADVTEDDTEFRSGDASNNARESGGVSPDAVTISPVQYGTQTLPDPVRRMRTNLIRIARSGELESLRPYLGSGPGRTVVSFGNDVDDPIGHLREQSGDPEGAEILAILLEVLQSGYVEIEPGEENAIYVWPYFAQTRLDTLDKRQKVELFELVTAGDYDMMLDFGAYNFYRVGITPEGSLAFFVSGD